MIRLGVATALVLALGACTPGGQFDPTELLNLDMLQTKKKIEGQREPVFPEGVPGAAAAGVPPELMQGYQAPPEKAADATASTTAAPPTAAPPTEAKVEPKPKAKPKPKPKVARAPPPQPAAAPQMQQQRQQPHDPAWDRVPVPGQQAQPQSPWPAAPGSAPAQQAQTGQTVWPAPPGAAPAQPATQWPNPPPTSK